MDKKIDCKYWDKCFRKNTAHYEKYNHPPSSSTSDSATNASAKDQDSQGTKKVDKLKRSASPRKDSSKSQFSMRRNTLSPRRSTKEGSTSPQSKAKPAKETENINEESNSSQESKRNSKEIDITKEYEEALRVAPNKAQYLQELHERIQKSENAHYENLLKTPEFISYHFLVHMPSDFYKFWEYCVFASENNKNTSPQSIFEKFGLQLVGPFDYLSGKFNKEKIHEPSNYLRHWRFYYDPPEFQTVFVKSNTCIHYGYWRDDPIESNNLLMAKNDADKGCKFEFVGGNCFETVLYYLEEECPSTPFNHEEILEMKKSIKKYMEENNLQYPSLDTLKEARDKKVVCKTFHGAGLVIPLDQKTGCGYQALLKSGENLKDILFLLSSAKGDTKKIEDVNEMLQPIINAATIASDESDFSACLQLGIDLFSSGYKELHDVLRFLLIIGYLLLKRPQFIAIMKSHLECRREGNNLSIFE